MSGLTKQQMRTQAFIEGYVEQFGFCPSYDDIADALGFRSKSNASRIVGILIERGYLRKKHKCARALEVIRHVLTPRCCSQCGHNLNEVVEPVLVWPKNSHHSLRAA